MIDLWALDCNLEHFVDVALSSRLIYQSITQIVASCEPTETINVSRLKPKQNVAAYVSGRFIYRSLRIEYQLINLDKNCPI